MTSSPIPWDKLVEFFHTGTDMQVAGLHMTLGDAVAHFVELPVVEQDRCGIGVHEALLTMIDDRPAALGFLQPNAIRQLAKKR